MKYLERFVIRELYDDVKNVLDPFHFTYKDKRGTGDAVNTLVHLVLKHLDQPQAYARVFLLILAQHLIQFSHWSYWRK